MSTTTLTAQQVAARYSVSKITIWRRAKEGAIPAPVRIGPKTVRWHAATLDEFDRLLADRGKTALFDELREIDETHVST